MAFHQSLSPTGQALLFSYYELDRSVLELIFISFRHQWLSLTRLLPYHYIWEIFFHGVGILLIHPYFIAEYCVPIYITTCFSYWLTGLFAGAAIMNKAVVIILMYIYVNIVICLLMGKYSKLLAHRGVFKKKLSFFSPIWLFCTLIFIFGVCKLFFWSPYLNSKRSWARKIALMFECGSWHLREVKKPVCHKTAPQEVPKTWNLRISSTLWKVTL